MHVIDDPNPPIPKAPRVLVPTMGALHPGHLALIRRARDIAGPDGEVAVSIFVNPIQFDRPDDLKHYPRPLEEDLELCRAEGVDLLYNPSAESMYPPGHSVKVIESSLSQTLCGATRPGHFDGVCTVVLKLFQRLRPRAAVFGEKDYQQLAIIRRMVRDLDLPVEIIAHPTLRESDGLAMSSRNQRLSPEHRADAPRIRRALEAAAEAETTEKAKETARSGIEASPFARIDYLEAVHPDTLRPTASRPAVLATAVYYDEIRLIDHILLP